MPSTAPTSRPRPLEFAGIAGLLALAVYFIALSWRKWPDPMVDFGRELYTPWRLADGAVLYRDVDDFYGPLSQYFNALLFRLAGPGMMVLVAVNLAIYAGILALLYALFRRAWGALAAFATAFVFVSVFSFSQLSQISNYNYATPYAHEVTHGLLVCLALAAALLRLCDLPTRARAFTAGSLFGLTLVLKPEFIVGGSALTIVAAVFQWRRAGAPRRALAATWAGGAVLPTLLFAAYFATKVSLGDALHSAGRAWLNVVDSAGYAGDPVQKLFLGFDQPWPNLLAHLVATAAAAVLLASLPLAARASARSRSRWMQLLPGIGAPLAVGIIGWFWVPWITSGRCLLALTGAYAIFKARSLLRGPALQAAAPRELAQLLLAVLGAALMARMLLNGRVFQFGFYQAAIAAMVVTAVMIGEAADWTKAAGRGRSIVIAGTALLIGSGIVHLTTLSRNVLALKTVSVGSGRDLFYGFPQMAITPRRITDYLAAHPTGTTLLVLPQGLMINYLTRKPSPVAPFFFFSVATANGREARLVEQLQRHPPDWVVLNRDDLREYGIEHYGESPGHGQLLIEWLRDNYLVNAVVDEDPNDPNTIGAYVFRPKQAARP